MTSISNPKRFILLGDAGAGKSSFINFLYNLFYGTQEPAEIFCDQPKVKLAIPCANWLDCLDQEFRNNDSERDIDDQTQSQTQICTTYTLRSSKIHLELIDSPGFNDTSGTNVDEHNLTLIEQTLKSLPYLSGIILVVNGARPRLGLPFKNFLHLLHQVWPNDLLNNCLAVLTNCDELSVNLDPLILQKDLNVDKSKTFHFQNSLFRWDRKNQTAKTIRRFRQDFEDNVEKINQFLATLLQFKDISTEAFEIGAIKILIIENCVYQSIQNIIDLLEAYKAQQIAQDGVKNAQYTMDNNKQWEQQREIKAFKWVEVPQPKFTRQSIFSSRSKTSPQEFSSSPIDREVHRSRYSNNEHEKTNSYPAKNNPLPSQNLSKSVDDDHRYKQGIYSASSVNYDDTNKYSSSSSKTFQPSNNYSSAYDNPSSNKKSYTVLSSSKTTESSSKPIEGKTNDKVHLSRSLSSNNNDHSQPDRYSTKVTSSYFDNHVTYASNNPSFSRTPVYKRQETKVQVTILDNEARSHHDYAQRQAIKLQEKSQELRHEQEVLSTEIKSYLQALEEQVAELRSINRNYDIIEKHRDLLLAFKEVIKYFGDDPQMTHYYDQTVNILSKK